MSKTTPLDPKRWVFAQPKWAGKDLPNVPGFGVSHEKNVVSELAQASSANEEILVKHAWNTALAPGKSVFMNLFMIWMMGTGSGIFSILMVGYAVMNSFSSLFQVNEAFKMFSINVILQKLLYVLINIAVLGYLCSHAANMGLFPINSGDWVAYFPNTLITERAYMMSAKVLVEYPALSEIIEELDERFIIGLDRAVLTDSKLIFFKIQKAFWYYKDHFEDVIRRRLAPNLGLDAFGQILIEQSALLSQIYPHSLRESKFREWQDYLRRVPRLGAICLNPALTKVLMIQPFGRNRKNLQFPRGKLHAGEDHVKAAAREVWEECGIRLENLIDSQIFFQHVIDTTMHKLYLVFPVMEELVPTIQCNKEIEAILWVPLVELPGWTANSEDDKGFFGVAPFVKDIKRFVLSHRKETNPIEEDEDNNFKTFGINEGRWSFEQMMSANSQLFGVKSTYSDAVFAQKYDARPQEEEIPSGLSVLLVSAFARGWNRR